MKPFNLEAAKSGAPVVTRDGKPVRIICWDRQASDGRRETLVALVSDPDGAEVVVTCSPNGRHYSGNAESSNDLFIAPTKRTGWILVFPACIEKGVPSAFGSYIYTSVEDAASVAREYKEAVVAEISWEE